jgi:hypothetical protein
MRYVIVVLTVLGLWSCGTLSKNEFELLSPDEGISLSVGLDSEGIIRYNIHRGDELLVSEAALGMVFDSIDFTKNVRVKSASKSSFSEVWEPVWGQFSEIENSYNQLDLIVSKEAGQSLKIVFRLFNDGIGFRYELPGEGEVVITEETTQFNMASDNAAWWVAPCWENDEYIYQNTKLSEVTIELRNQSAPEGHATHFACETGFNTPVTMKTPEGTYLSIHEAAIWDYPGSSLCLNPDNLEITVSPAPTEDYLAKVELPFHTPWRTITIGERPGDLIESNLILNLNEPQALDDVSFIEPMKYVGIWWEMHVKRSTWEMERSENHGAHTANVKRYIDFASENGIRGVLVEGWNQGWDGWVNFNFTSPYPDFDMQEIATYAAQKGVQIIGHHETGGQVVNYMNQMEDAYGYYQANGLSSLKSGYVGGVEGQHHYNQWMVNHYNDALVTAAEYQISLNVHEPIKPSGISRTYPNLLSGEGMRGQEFNAWSSGNALDHHSILPFTRNLAGPMDYTPGIFDLKLLNSVNAAYAQLQTIEERKAYEFKHRVKSTLAHQLALYVVFYSPVQMAADLPENYEGHPAFQFIRDVPVDWADTKVLDAEIGAFCVTARKDKHSDDWFVGGITNEDPRRQQVDLSFLDEGVSYIATIYADAADADWDLNPTNYNITTMEVKKGDFIDIDMVTGGGFALSLKRL